MKQLLLLFLFSVVIGSTTLMAQDKIYLREGAIIICHVTNIDKDYIHYEQADVNPDVRMSISRSKVQKIVYETGDELIINRQQGNGGVERLDSRPISDPGTTDMDMNKNMAIKMAFFSPISGSLNFGFEYSLGKSRSLDMGLGIIGVGGTFNPIYLVFFIPNKDPDAWENPFGTFLQLGYKFMRDPYDYSAPSLLKGSYLRPTISYTFIASDTKVYYENPKPGQDLYTITRTNTNIFAFMVYVGKQWVLQDLFLLDLNFGIGYGFGLGDEGKFVYSHVQGGNTFPLAISGGFKFGFVF